MKGKGEWLLITRLKADPELINYGFNFSFRTKFFPPPWGCLSFTWHFKCVVQKHDEDEPGSRRAMETEVQGRAWEAKSWHEIPLALTGTGFLSWGSTQDGWKQSRDIALCLPWYAGQQCHLCALARGWHFTLQFQLDGSKCPKHCARENSEVSAFIKDRNSDQVVISPLSSKRSDLWYICPPLLILILPKMCLKIKDASLEWSHDLLSTQGNAYMS